jgi:hypothetical protein
MTGFALTAALPLLRKACDGLTSVFGKGTSDMGNSPMAKATVAA